MKDLSRPKVEFQNCLDPEHQPSRSMPTLQIEQTFTQPYLVEQIVSFLASREMSRIGCATSTFRTAVVSANAKVSQRFMLNHPHQFFAQVDTYNSAHVFIGEDRVIKKPVPGHLVPDCVDLPRSSMWEGLAFYDAFPPEKWDATVRVTATEWSDVDLSGVTAGVRAQCRNPYFTSCQRDIRIKDASFILCSSLEHELDPEQALRGLLQSARMTGGIIYLSSCNFQQSGTTELDANKLLRIAESLNGVLNTVAQDRTTIRCIPGSHGCDLLEVSPHCISPLHFFAVYPHETYVIAVRSKFTF